MTWFGWFLAGWLLFGALSAVGMVGRERKPLTPGQAVFHMIIAGLLIAAVLWVGTGTGVL